MNYDSENIHAHSAGDRVEVQASRTRGQVTHAVALDFPKEDAPAVALAILEAAGYAEGLDEYDPGEMRAPVHVAVERLRMVQDERTKRAAREAEDAKSDEFRRLDWEATTEHNRRPFVAWENIDDDTREDWRRRYKAARDFFRESP